MAAFVAGERRDLAGLHEDHAQALEEHHGFHEVGGGGVGAVEACLALLITDALADDDQRDDARDGADAQ